MLSQYLMFLLGIQYLVIAVLSLFEENYIKSLYWFGATILNISVMLSFSK